MWMDHFYYTLLSSQYSQTVVKICHICDFV